VGSIAIALMQSIKPWQQYQTFALSHRACQLKSKSFLLGSFSFLSLLVAGMLF
jgi:hypothetical protein